MIFEWRDFDCIRAHRFWFYCEKWIFCINIHSEARNITTSLLVQGGSLGRTWTLAWCTKTIQHQPPGHDAEQSVPSLIRHKQLCSSSLPWCTRWRSSSPQSGLGTLLVYFHQLGRNSNICNMAERQLKNEGQSIHWPKKSRSTIVHETHRTSCLHTALSIATFDNYGTASRK